MPVTVVGMVDQYLRESGGEIWAFAVEQGGGGVLVGDEVWDGGWNGILVEVEEGEMDGVKRMVKRI